MLDTVLVGAARRGVRLGSAQSRAGHLKVAYEALKYTLATYGEKRPGSNHIPQSITTVVKKDMWRRVFNERDPLPEGAEKTEVRRRLDRFRDAARSLQDTHQLVGVWDDWAWLTSGESDRSGNSSPAQSPSV